MKRGRRKAVHAVDRAHMGYVATLPCLVCGAQPVTVHHVSSSIHGGRIARSHIRTAPLCARHHLIQWGPRESVEALGHRGFYETHGVDLLAEADRIWRESPANLAVDGID